MERNNIIAAPQVADVDAAFDRWSENHIGSRNDFYDFLTSPGAERDRFFSDNNTSVNFIGLVAAQTIID